MAALASSGTGGMRRRRCLGWREWVSLPELGVTVIKAKVDSGARTSTLHAYDIKTVRRGSLPRVRFTIFPQQRSKSDRLTAEADVVAERYIRSSLGHLSLRPVIVTTLEIAGIAWPIELTLVDRDVMGFRMLLGREAIARRFLVDPGRSYLLSSPSELRPQRSATEG